MRWWPRGRRGVWVRVWGSDTWPGRQPWVCLRDCAPVRPARLRSCTPAHLHAHQRGCTLARLHAGTPARLEACGASACRAALCACAACTLAHCRALFYINLISVQLPSSGPRHYSWDDKPAFSPVQAGHPYFTPKELRATTMRSGFTAP